MTKTIEGLAFIKSTVIQKMSGYEVQTFRLTFHDHVRFAKKTAEAIVRGHIESRRRYGKILKAETLDSLDFEASKEIMDMLLTGPTAAGIKSIEHLPHT